MIAQPLTRREQTVNVVALLAAGAILALGVRTLVVPTPAACVTAIEQANVLFKLQDDLVEAVTERGDALEPDAYAVHDADANHLQAAMTDVAADYDTAKAECLGVDQ